MWSVNDLTYSNKTAGTIDASGGALVGIVSGDTVTLGSSNVTATFASKTVASGIAVTVSGMTLRGASATNYTIVQPGLTGNIVPRTLTISAITDRNKVYDGTTAATISTAGAVISGVLAADSANLTLDTSGATGTFSSANVGNGLTVTITGLTLAGSAAGNYVVSVTPRTANITAAPLSISGIIAADKVYDTTNSATLDTSGMAFVGLIAGDLSNVSLDTTSASGTFSSVHMGTGLTVTISGLVLIGSAASNYTVVQPSTTAFITAATLTVTGITASDKAFDGMTTATLNNSGATLVGALGSDVVTLNTIGAIGTFAASSVASGITVNISGLTLTRAAASDYQLTQPITTADIT